MLIDQFIIEVNSRFDQRYSGKSQKLFLGNKKTSALD